MKPPTWHFYLQDEGTFADIYRSRPAPAIRTMIDADFECRKQYPRMEETWSLRRPAPR
jgi:hypothetical protein